MAKKTVATLRTEKSNLTKLVITEKSPKTGAYMFKEIMVGADKVKDYIN